ncbi:MAG: YbbR-like domain-containing protein [Christensenellales bacterium]|jgi:YbbR domain-containing protein
MEKLTEFFKRNTFMKLVSIFFAILLWNYVLSETNPVRDKTINNVTVQLRNESVMKDLGLTIRGDIKTILEDVSVELEGPLNDLNYITRDNITAYIDLSKINKVGQHTLKIQTESMTMVKVSPVSPEYVTLDIDVIAEREIPVEVNLIGSPPIGYWAGVAQLTPETIMLKGAKEDIDKVSKAVCDITLTNLTSTVNENIKVKFFDAEGRQLEENYLGSDYSVIARMEVLPKKTVNVDVAGSLAGIDDIAPGYEVRSMEAFPQTVEIVGDPDIMARTFALRVESIDVQNANKDIIGVYRLTVPSGLKVISGDEVEIKVQITEKREIRQFENLPIDISGAKGVTVTPDRATADVTITGKASLVKSMKADDIKLFVDVAGLSKGRHELEVRYSLPEELMEKDVFISPASINVTIR